MSELRIISRIMEENKEDPQAWENVCDWLSEAKPITSDRIEKCKTSMEYLTNVYPSAVRAAKAMQVMASVPVFTLVHLQQNGTEQFISLTDNNVPSFVPLFFTKEQAVKEIENIETEGASVSCLCLPFFLFTDTEGYGIFADSNPPIIFALCDPRPNKPWMFFTKQEIINLMLDASAALRSSFVGDVIKIVSDQIASTLTYPVNPEDESRFPNGGGPAFYKGKKPPVS